MAEVALSPAVEAALDAPLPVFPEIAWRGMFESYRALMAEDPEAPDSPISECPMTFHFANFLAIVAAEMGDRVRMAEGYANLFVFCCGRTGTKKSTATDYVEDYIVKRFPDTAYHKALGSVSSAEGLIRTLGQTPNLHLRYDEVKDLFVTSARSGQRLEPILNKAFDMRRLEAVVKRSKDSLLVDEYYLNVLVNGTPDHVLLDMSETLFKGGLLNRFLVFAAHPTGIAKPEKGVPDYELSCALARRVYNQCLAWRTEAPVRAQVRMRLSPEAAELHKAWYVRHTLAQQLRSDLEAAPLTRLDLFTKKIAMLYALTEMTPNKAPFITPAQMESALAVVEFCAACMQWMTAAWAGSRSQTSQAAQLAEQRIEGYLKAHGCTRERYLYRYLHFSARDCAQAVNALVAMGTAAVTGEHPRLVHLVGKCLCDT